MEKKRLLSLLVITMLALFFAPSVADAQQRNMSIVTNHPDFSIKVKRCAASGKTVIIDMILENLGTNDVSIRFCAGNNWSNVYDDQGNKYGSGTISYKFANDNYNGWFTSFYSLIAGVPVKFSMKIEGVPLDAESIARIQMGCDCDEWGLNTDKPVVIRFVPITRQ